MDPEKGDRVIATKQLSRMMSGTYIAKGKQGVVVDVQGGFLSPKTYTVSFDGHEVKNVPKSDIAKL